MTRTSSAKLRRSILKQRGVELAKLTRKPTTHDDIPALYPKTRLMKYIELKFKDRLENIIFTGTIYELEKKLGIDATTISKWRKLISETNDKAFWKQFPDATTGKGE